MKQNIVSEITKTNASSFLCEEVEILILDSEKLLTQALHEGHVHELTIYSIHVLAPKILNQTL